MSLLLSWLLWGGVGTLLLTLAALAGRQLRLTRMDLPYMLGTMLTPDRDRANVVGLAAHLLMGWAFALLYIGAFVSWGGAGWWRGAAIGLVHGVAVVAILMPALPGFHRRMASDSQGPEVTAQLEPPGFLGLNYGYQTPLVTVIAHVVYGAVLGSFILR